MSYFVDREDEYRVDEAAVFNENYYRYLTEEEGITSEEAHRIVYGH